MMERRRFLLTSLAGALAAPLGAEAQPPGKIARVGLVSSGGPEQERSLISELRELLRRRGWAEGQNLALDLRYANGNYERAPDLVGELIRLKPDVLMTRGGPVTAAAKRATSITPIVMWSVTDPVGIGLVVSLPRPGGNITGLSDDESPDIVSKRLQLLKEIAPKVSVVAALTRVRQAAAPRVTSHEHAYDAAGAALGLQLRRFFVSGPDDIDRAFAECVAGGVGAIEVVLVPVTWIHRRQILDLAERHRLPAMYWHRQYVLEGGLIEYGEDEREVPKRLAGYVDKILRGAKPADLSVEQPTKFDLVINLKTAKVLGLTIPPSLLARADQVIE
jgi:putative tryptophan/tyrosine transport system substrate-binding protein